MLPMPTLLVLIIVKLQIALYNLKTFGSGLFQPTLDGIKLR